MLPGNKYIVRVRQPDLDQYPILNAEFERYAFGNGVSAVMMISFLINFFKDRWEKNETKLYRAHKELKKILKRLDGRKKIMTEWFEKNTGLDPDSTANRIIFGLKNEVRTKSV